MALDKDETTVLGSGKNLQNVIDIAKKKGFKDPIIMNVPENLVTYVG